MTVKDWLIFYFMGIIGVYLFPAIDTTKYSEWIRCSCCKMLYKIPFTDHTFAQCKESWSHYHVDVAQPDLDRDGSVIRWCDPNWNCGDFFSSSKAELGGRASGF